MAAKKDTTPKTAGPAADKKAALETALAQIEKQFGKGAVMKLGANVTMQVDAIPTGSLGTADLQHQPAARAQRVPVVRGQQAVKIETVRAAVQRRFRLFLHFALQKRQLACLNIRRVRRDEIEPIRQRLRKSFI